MSFHHFSQWYIIFWSLFGLSTIHAQSCVCVIQGFWAPEPPFNFNPDSGLDFSMLYERVLSLLKIQNLTNAVLSLKLKFINLVFNAYLSGGGVDVSPLFYDLSPRWLAANLWIRVDMSMKINLRVTWIKIRERHIFSGVGRGQESGQIVQDIRAALSLFFPSLVIGLCLFITPPQFAVRGRANTTNKKFANLCQKEKFSQKRFLSCKHF